MSSLVSEFIINPVLRQARRFSEISRSTFIGDGEEPTSQPQNTIDEHSPAERPESITDFTSAVESLVTRPLSVPARESDIEYSLPSPIMAETSSVQQSRSNMSPPGSKKLPENDGMGELRSRIQAINAQEISTNDKARLMHDTLLEGYRATRTVTHTRVHSHGGETYVSTLEQSPSQPLKFWQNAGDAPSSERFHLSKEDLKPTRVPVKQPKHTGHDPNDSPEPLFEEDQPFGCAHYERNVKLQCSTCKKWYTCRFCHDANEDHNLIRPETKNMLCMLCGTPQKASDLCVGCGEIAAHYYCNICKLWENRPSKPIYHCNDCGICRKGMGLGKDFFHCKTCRACISTSIESTHKCIERSTECDCPICGEYLFTSPRPVVFMPCGHSIHKKCYEAHMKVSYKCPICNKSLTNMESQFRNLDVAIQTQPMPSEFQDTTAVVLCNDCSGRSTVRYHWLGLKCSICRSYNTVELQILGPDDRRVQPTIAETGEAVNTAVVPPAVVDDGPTPAATVATRAIAATGRRRHSSHGIEAQIDFPDRVARSLSPLDLGFGSIMGLLTHDGDSDDDILGIWRGRDLGGDRGSNNGDEMDSDGDLSDLISDSDEDNDGDDDDEEDDINEISLYGHR